MFGCVAAERSTIHQLVTYFVSHLRGGEQVTYSL